MSDFTPKSPLLMNAADVTALQIECARLTKANAELRKALERSLEVLEFAYMNAPKQPKEIAEARKALANSSEGE